MKFGIVFPQTEFPADPIAIRDFAQAAESLGFNHLLAYDHILGANPKREGGWTGPYTFRDPFQEPLTLFSYLAGLTTRLRFVSGIIILPQRETALFAKQTATLDVLSQGRLRLGFGVGWNEVEYTSQNKDFHNRGQRIEEQIEVLRLLWTQPLVSFKGQWHDIPDAGLNPLPVQRPIPIWFGGHADLVLRRIAKIGDGWLPLYSTPDEGAQAFDKLASYLSEHGRSMKDIGLEPKIRYGNGNPETWQMLHEAWQSAGATHLTVNIMNAGFKKPQDHIQAMSQIAEVLEINN